MKTSDVVSVIRLDFVIQNLIQQKKKMCMCCYSFWYYTFKRNYLFFKIHPIKSKVENATKSTCMYFNLYRYLQSCRYKIRERKNVHHVVYKYKQGYKVQVPNKLYGMCRAIRGKKGLKNKLLS